VPKNPAPPTRSQPFGAWKLVNESIALLEPAPQPRQAFGDSVRLRAQICAGVSVPPIKVG
jgi:hypothetical protein